MWRALSRTGIAAGMLAAPLAFATPAHADWPTSRHDPLRTGASTGVSDIKKPAAYWRSYLGGALSGTQVYVGDVDQDGTTDVLFLAGGALTLARPDGTVLWRTPPAGYLSIVNVVDVDRDGQLDAVVYNGAPAQVSIINGASGAIEWVEPAGELGSPGAFRVGDLDGDGSPDLWLDTCGCCAVENGSPGVLYSFASGFGAAAKLGTPPPRSHCGAASNTLVDLDGDGRLELVSMAEDTATMFRGDGTIVATSGTIPGHAYAALCEGTNLDGQPGDELICFNNTVYGGGGERGMFALAYRPAETPALKLLWQQTVSPADGGDARAPAVLAVDLDGDGRLETTISGKVNGAYTTTVFDALTGSPLATTAGIVAGDVAAVTPARRWLLVSTGTAVEALSFSRNPAGLTPVWQAANQRPPTRLDWSRATRSALSASLITPDLDGDTHPDLVLTSMSEPAELAAFSTVGGAPSGLGTYVLGAGVNASALGVPQSASGASKLFVARTDGYLTMLDGTLAPTNLQKEGVDTLPGMQVGGYYTGPGAYNSYGRTAIAGKLHPGDAADALMVVDSRGDLVRIDPTGASNVAPAKPTWRLQDTFGAGMRTAGAGSAVVGAFRRRHPVSDPPVYAMVSIDDTGHEVAGLTLQQPPQYDVLPGDILGDGSTALVGQTIDPALNTSIVAMSTSGAALWQRALVASAGTQPFAMADWNGDGAADVAAVINVAHVYSGHSGAEIATGSDAISYAMPILARIGAGPQLGMIVQGAYFSARGLGHDLSSLWVSNGPALTYPFGGLATCGPEQVLLEGTFSVPAELAITPVTGASAGASTTVVLASGAAYSDAAAATAAGARQGQLGDVAVSANLDGAGLGPTALIGSTDGFLYGVDACTGALRWALSLGLPVGSPILADTDGDGKDEILVSVADGYLYALKDEVLPAPAQVWDTDPPHGITMSDVQDIHTIDTLYAAWTPVPGAASYEVAVVASGGTYVTNPNWIDVGSSTSAVMPGLALVDGAKYFVGVRAVSSAGRSPDRSSDGVIVHLPPGKDGGVGGGDGGDTTPAPAPLTGRACTCSAPGALASVPLRELAWLGALGAIALVRVRRRDKRSSHR